MTFVRVTGYLDGVPVWATWADGVVFGDVRLLGAAQRHVDAHDDVPVTEDGPFLHASLADPWSFTATISCLVDDPTVSGDDLPHVASQPGAP